MKYVVTMNGKRYEVEVERMSAFHMLTREEIASGVSTRFSRLQRPLRRRRLRLRQQQLRLRRQQHPLRQQARLRQLQRLRQQRQRPAARP